MRDFDWGEREQLPEDNGVEIVDLEPLEESVGNTAFWSTSRFLAWQRSWSRRRFRLLTSLSMVVLIVAVLLFSLHGTLPIFISLNGNVAPPIANMAILANDAVPAPVHIKASVELLPQEVGIACLADSVWSPDSSSVAFLGYKKDCVYGSHVYEHGLVAIYSGLSGKLVRLLSPDDAIFHTLHTQFPTIHTVPDIYYDSLLWSPDGHSIALTFSLGLPSQTLLAAGNIVGVALVDNSSGRERVMMGTHQDNGSPVEWDVQEQREMASMVIPSLIPPARTPAYTPAYTSATIPVLPAFAYRWGPNGTLIPEFIRGHYLRIPRSKVDRLQIGHIGNPDGEQSFTLWQPGIGMLNTRDSMGHTYTPGFFTWNTNFSAWSPDERYLISSVYIKGVLQLPGQPFPDSQTLAKFHMNSLPYFAVRDLALQRLLLALDASTFNIVVAWHPAGFFLAAYDYGMVDLDLYDCSTGANVALLELPDELRTDLSGTTVLRWSPDGTRLLLFDAQLSTVTIWNVSKVA